MEKLRQLGRALSLLTEASATTPLSPISDIFFTNAELGKESSNRTAVRTISEGTAAARNRRKEICEALASLATLFQDEDTISPYELETSGLIEVGPQHYRRLPTLMSPS